MNDQQESATAAEANANDTHAQHVSWDAEGRASEVHAQMVSAPQVIQRNERYTQRQLERSRHILDRFEGWNSEYSASSGSDRNSDEAYERQSHSTRSRHTGKAGRASKRPSSFTERDSRSIQHPSGQRNLRQRKVGLSYAMPESEEDVDVSEAEVSAAREAVGGSQCREAAPQQGEMSKDSKTRHQPGSASSENTDVEPREQ